MAAALVGPMSERVMDSVHAKPAWRTKSDFIIGAKLPEAGRSEQLWARRIELDKFEVCCIPFFVYNIALGDIVETDANFEIQCVVEHAGRFVFRIWFGDPTVSREEVAEELQRRGALLEWSSASLLAVDAADSELAQDLADYLHEHEVQGHLVYETGAL